MELIDKIQELIGNLYKVETKFFIVINGNMVLDKYSDVYSPIEEVSINNLNYLYKELYYKPLTQTHGTINQNNTYTYTYFGYKFIHSN